MISAKPYEPYALSGNSFATRENYAQLLNISLSHAKQIKSDLSGFIKRSYRF